MTRMLLSDLYRLAHGRMLWGSLVALLAILAAVVAFYWWGTSEQFAQTVGEGEVSEQSVGLSATDESVSLGVAGDGGAQGSETHADDSARVMQSRTYVYAGVLVSGGFLPLFVSVIVVVLTSGDFETGLVKTLFAGRRSKASFYAARVALAVGLVVLLYVVGVVFLDVAMPLAGFAYRSEDTAAQWWAYVGLGALSAVCYALISLLVSVVTRSKVMGVVLAVLLSMGVLGQLVVAALAPVTAEAPVVADALSWLPSQCLQLMTGGAQRLFSAGEVAGLPAPLHALVGFAVPAVAAGALSVLVGARRDLA